MHLTHDHLFGLAKYWKLSETETDFFLLLLDKERAATSALRERHLERMKRLQSEHQNLSNRVKRPLSKLGEKDLIYYSSWHYSAIHILVSIPKYQTAQTISEYLNIDRGLVEQTLRTLRDMGLVRYSKEKWLFNSSEIHLPKKSPLTSLHHQNWRARAILNSQKQDQESLHFSVVQSIDRKAWDQIKERILVMIDEVSEIAGPSKEEILISFCCDIFQV